MPLVLKDRVKETSTTAGTGALTLAGAVAGYQSFSVIGNGNTTYYTIVDSTANTWEVGIGTYTASGTSLSRDTILESSSGGSAVSFASNAKDVFVTYPAERAAAPTAFTATASGAIAAGDPVVVNATGTVSTMRPTSPATMGTSSLGTTGTYDFAITTNDSTTNKHQRYVYEPYSGRLVFVYRNTSNSNYPTAIVSSGSGSVSTIVIASHAVSELVVTTYRGVLLFAYINTAASSVITVKAGTINTSGVITLGSALAVSVLGNFQGQISAAPSILLGQDPDNTEPSTSAGATAQFTVVGGQFFRSGTSDYRPAAVPVRVPPTLVPEVPGIQTIIDTASAVTGQTFATADPSTGRVVVTYNVAGPNIKAVVLQPTASSFTVGTAVVVQTLTGFTFYQTETVYDAAANRMLVLTNAGYTNYTAMSINAATNAITAGTTNSTVSTGKIVNNSGLGAFCDPLSGTTYAVIRSTSDNLGYVFRFTISGLTVTFQPFRTGTTLYQISSNTISAFGPFAALNANPLGQTSSGDIAIGQGSILYYDNTLGTAARFVRIQSNNGARGAFGSFAGISSAAVADGATATITSVGGIVGYSTPTPAIYNGGVLIPGRKYYVRRLDGTIDANLTSPSPTGTPPLITAGIAASASQLIVGAE